MELRFSSAEEIIRALVFSWWVITVFCPSISLIKLPDIELRIPAISEAWAYLRYITSIESFDIISLSNESRVDIIFLVIKSLADSITEFEGEKGIAINLFIVGLFWAFNLSRILTASIEDKFSSLIIDILAVLFLSKSESNSLILSILLARSTINIEFTEGILDKWDCLPVMGFIIGRISSVDLFIKGITSVSKPPPFE